MGVGRNAHGWAVSSVPDARWLVAVPGWCVVTPLPKPDAGETVTGCPRQPRPPVPPRWFIRSFWIGRRALCSVTRGRFGLPEPRADLWEMLRLWTIGRRSGAEHKGDPRPHRGRPGPRAQALGFLGAGANHGVDASLDVVGQGSVAVLPNDAGYLLVRDDPDSRAHGLQAKVSELLELPQTPSGRLMRRGMGHKEPKPTSDHSGWFVGSRTVRTRRGHSGCERQVPHQLEGRAREGARRTSRLDDLGSEEVVGNLPVQPRCA